MPPAEEERHGNTTGKVVCRLQGLTEGRVKKQGA